MPDVHNSTIAFEDQSQTLEGEPGRMHGETPTFLDQQGRPVTGGDDGDVGDDSGEGGGDGVDRCRGYVGESSCLSLSA